MSYWKSCDNCSLQMSHPSTLDALIGEKDCEACGHAHKLDRWDREHRISDVLDRLDRLERHASPP